MKEVDVLCGGSAKTNTIPPYTMKSTNVNV